jgi:hypothetical protein
MDRDDDESIRGGVYDDATDGVEVETEEEADTTQEL